MSAPQSCCRRRRKPLGLPPHPLLGGCLSRDTVDRPGEVQGLLDAPDLLVLRRRKDVRGISDGHPADRHHRAVLEHGVDVNTPLIRTSTLCPRRAPGNTELPVARKQPSPTTAPLTCACGPTSTSSPRTVGCFARPRSGAFSITTHRVPTSTLPSSAVMTAPNNTRVCGPTRTLLRSTAVGAVGSTVCA
jgi:hypothetical protein